MKKAAIISLFLIMFFPAANSYAGVSFNFFYSSLAPHGSWFELSGGVYAWHPYGISASWTPYSRGQWVWTDDGWYWDSYEPYGWAVYHYGRWFNDDYYGWIWTPDYQWAPSWVEWRYDDDYIGWAPLPPYAVFRPGFGIHFTLGWNAPHHYWNYVHYNHFCHNNVGGYFIREKEKYRIHEHTKYRNDYGYGNGHVKARGVERNDIEKRGGREVAQRKINFTDRNSGSRTGRNGTVEAYIPSARDVDRTRNAEVTAKRADRSTSLRVDKIETRKPVQERAVVRERQARGLEPQSGHGIRTNEQSGSGSGNEGRIRQDRSGTQNRTSGTQRESTGRRDENVRQSTESRSVQSAPRAERSDNQQMRRSESSQRVSSGRAGSSETRSSAPQRNSSSQSETRERSRR